MHTKASFISKFTHAQEHTASRQDTWDAYVTYRTQVNADGAICLHACRSPAVQYELSLAHWFESYNVHQHALQIGIMADHSALKLYMQAESHQKDMAAQMVAYAEEGDCLDGFNGTLDSGALITDVIPQGVTAMLAAAPGLTAAACCPRCMAAPDRTHYAKTTEVFVVTSAHRSLLLMATPSYVHASGPCSAGRVCGHPECRLCS